MRPRPASLISRHPRESGDPVRSDYYWVPAFAGMTNWGQASEAEPVDREHIPDLNLECSRVFPERLNHASPRRRGPRAAGGALRCIGSPSSRGRGYLHLNKTDPK